MIETQSFTLTQVETKYLETFMQQVSRSFALIVPCLEPPLNHFLATAYLICRVADNIEDCTQPAAWQSERFKELVALLKRPALAPAILSTWDEETWPGLTGAERRLMSAAEGGMLWQIYASTPQPARGIIGRWVAEMAQGMMNLADPDAPPFFLYRQQIWLPSSKTDYDRYCYFVAGTVGHLSTELVIHHYQLPAEVARRLAAWCEACGRGLQKTNIVKDFSKDLARGICYLPDEWLAEVNYAPLSLAGAPSSWKQKVVGNVLDELQDSVTYVFALPYYAAGYRLASLLCLLPAYQTLLLAARQQQTLFTGDQQVKISHETMARCLQDAQGMAADNEAIWRYSQQIRQAIEATFN